jgi:hypothetical protein
MTLEADRYAKVLQLLVKLRNSCELISEEVTNLHSKLKELSIKGESIQGTKAEI